MKIILSRKGFDSTNGKCPSPIMPDGTLLSMPIPAQEDVSYSDISWKGTTYEDILKQINPKAIYDRCHLDPDIRDNRVSKVNGWLPAFGQLGAAQGQLANAGVERGDLFLFFGWFRQVEDSGSGYRFVSRKHEDFYKGNDVHVIFGYMQIGEIITDQKKIKEYYWHPHSSSIHTESTNNVIYLPSERLSLEPSLKGYGTFDFRKDRVLTMEGRGRATWNEYSFLMPEHVYGNKKNSAKGGGLYYSGIWQELVVYESEDLIKWAKKLMI